jgi:hypothetical protein
VERTVPGGRGVPADVQAGAGDRLRARAVQHYAALAASGRSVIGVDIDRNKIALARQVAPVCPERT